MVVQQGQAVPVWGWAGAGESITVSLAGQRSQTTADAQGHWKVSLQALKPGAPLTMMVAGKNTVTIQDVLVGEVWLASGQSNMQYRMAWDKVYNAPDIAVANDPQLRMITVPSHASATPENDVKAAWTIATPTTVLDFSAVAYYYGLNLRKALGVPVGIIQSSYGGTQGESWVSREALDSDPNFHEFAEHQIDQMTQAPSIEAAFPAAIEAWIVQHKEVDAGNAGLGQGWARSGFDDSRWKTVSIGHTLASYGLKGGAIVWYRKSVELPANSDRADFTLNCNWLDGACQIYFNGTELSETSTPSVKFSKAQHSYLVPKALIQAGKPNLLAVRQYSLTADDIFGQRTSNMGWPVANPKALTDDWKFNIEQPFGDLSQEDVAHMPRYPQVNPQNTASYLFDAMIHPLIPFGIRGVIWYQGESNVPRPYTYQSLLTLLIKDWRQRWGEGDFPFYIVQLANYGDLDTNPVQDRAGNYHIREAQLQASQTVPNTGLAVAIDVGEESIHPRNKREVGRRLSLLALNRVYGREQADSGPIYSGMKIEGNKVRLTFANTEGGLVAKEGDLKQFSIAGADRHFVWAEARIDGDSVVVSSPEIASPVAVRYAWSYNPAGCNLYNRAGLPASPFRTDAWNSPPSPAVSTK